MAKTDFKTIDEYIATFPKDVQAILEQVRQVVRKAVPEVEEVISYQVPAFKYHGFVIYFSAHANHLSILSPPPTMDELKDELSAYKTSKSAVQFPYAQPIPFDLIERIAKYKAEQNIANSKK